jgi:predicted O-methyltransferase YrrM
VRSIAIRLLYLRSWGKLHHLATHPRKAWSFLLFDRETANFTYELTNESELPVYVGQATGLPIPDLREYLRELAADEELHTWLGAAIDRRDRTGRALVGRRAGWYILVRALKPRVVLETGTDVGMGSAVLARALQRNAEDGGLPGHLWTFDFGPEAGWATPEALGAWVTLVPGDLRQTLPRTVEDDLPGPIDLMIHDSDHSYEHEMFEFRTVGAHLAEEGVLLTDNGHVTTVLRDYSQDTGRRYSFWKEQPKDHPYPGAGIGLSVP